MRRGRSATGLIRPLLMHFITRNYDRHGPAGPSAFWKAVDGREPRLKPDDHWTNMDDDPILLPHNQPVLVPQTVNFGPMPNLFELFQETAGAAELARRRASGN